jgi:predicted MFS family arabinose efflux permease
VVTPLIIARGFLGVPARFVGVPNPYASLLRVRGGVAFSAAGFVARLPISMLGIGEVLLISSTSHRYGLAGAVTAASALAEAFGQPFLSRYVDRFGQARAVPPMVLVSSVSLVLLVHLATSGAPAWTLFVAGVVGGATFPNVGALVRARWSAALTGTPGLHTAFSAESVIDEVIFVLGPPLVTWVAVVVGPPQAVLVTVGLLVVGSALLLVQRSTEPPPSGGAHADGPGALSIAGVRVVVVMMIALGGVFGSFEVVTVAFAQQRGHTAGAGIVLAAYSFGSLVAGVVYGALRPRSPFHRQLRILGLVVPLTVLAFPFVERLAVLAALSVVSGLVVAPTLICSFQAVEALSPPGRLTEGLTLAGTGIVLGVAITAAVSGRVVDAVGTPHAYVVTTASGLLTAVAAVAGARWLRPDLPGTQTRVGSYPGPQRG